MEILGKLFGSSARIKIMRLFLLNPDAAFESKEVVKRSKVSRNIAKKELNLLSSIGFIRKKAKKLSLNPTFRYMRIIRTLLVESSFIAKEELTNRFKKAGKIKLLVVAGVFIQEDNSRTDLLVVGDNLRKRTIEETIKNIESEIGKEIAYAVFESKEFIYRLNMYDKLVRDILDYPHEKVIDKGLPGLST